MVAIFKLASILITILSLTCFTEAAGFTIDLVHRDSPLSPFYNSSQTHVDRFHNAYLRSMSRINRFKTVSVTKTKTQTPLQSPLLPIEGEYFMNISIGTPKVEVIGIADTGSDLTWIQCDPCEYCYDQKPPIFDPKSSSTFQEVTCESSYCHEIISGQRSCEKNVCGYGCSYGDGSFTSGNLAIENFTIGGSVSLPNIVFGCGHNNGGTFDEAGSGIIGLGGGSLSLVSQLSSSIEGKFSYCLVPISSNVSSKINFGLKGSVSSQDINVVSTKLVHKEPKTYYYVTLEAISVGKKRLSYMSSYSSSAEEGNIVIDSGTTLTILDSEFYYKLAIELEEAIGSKRRVSEPGGVLSVCFKGNISDHDLPIITFHFSGADLKLQPLNSFIRLDDGLVCSTMIPSDDFAIFGNLSQMNFLVGFDTVEKTVSFMPTDCTKK